MWVRIPSSAPIMNEKKPRTGTLGDRFTEEEVEQGLHIGFDWSSCDDEDDLYEELMQANPEYVDHL